MNIQTRLNKIESSIPKQCSQFEIRKFIGILLRYAVEYPESAKILFGYPSCITQADIDFIEANSQSIVGQNWFVEFPNYPETFKEERNE